jgi:retinol dehydrogenase-12
MKTVLVTGASGGIGREAARAIAQDGHHVIVAARNATQGQAVVAEIIAKGGAAEFLLIDLSSFASIYEAADRFLRAHSTLDVLVNNAACATARREVTPEGIERTWHTNFLGSFLLTERLLTSLKRAPSPRVINVSSEAHRTTEINWDDPSYTHGGFNGFKAYSQSKLAQILFTRELSRREPTIATNAVHPGTIATGIWRNAPQPFRSILMWMLPKPAKGAKPVVRLAIGADVEGVTGQYFKGMRPSTPSPAASNNADAARLWAMAEHTISAPPTRPSAT